jgi:ATP-binding cassette subfamily C protein CydC
MSAPPEPADVGALLAARAAGQRAALRGAILAAVAAALAATALLGLSGWFLTGAALAGLAGAAAVSAFNYLLPSAFIRLAAIVRTGGRYFERLLSHQAALRALAAVRVDVLARLAAIDPRRARALSGTEAAARLTGDVDALEDGIIRRPARPAAIAACLLALLLVALASPVAALLLPPLLAALPIGVSALARRLVDAPAAEAQARLGQLKAEMGEYLAAGPEIAIYGLAGEAAGRLRLAARQMDDAKRRAARGTAAAIGLLTVAGPGMAGLVLLLGQGAPALVAGAALAVLAAAEALGGPLRARLEDARVVEGLARLEALASAAPEAIGRLAGDGPLTLAIDDLLLQPGDTLALTGRSGSGKTRLLETLAGLRTDAPQQLRVGETDPRDVTFADLARQFALSPQDPVLIAGTVADNLRLARAGLSEGELWAALETAGLAAEVRAMPDGLFAWIGGDGARLSGGQRKRLALARALLAGRPWLLLDEPGEGLDAASAEGLAHRLQGWLRETGTGALIATHREGMAAICRQRLRLG